MKCIGRTKKFNRCKNDAIYLLFCHVHKFQWLAFIFTVLTVIGLFGGLYQDLWKPFFTYDNQNSNNIHETGEFNLAKEEYLNIQFKRDSIRNKINKFGETNPVSARENKESFQLVQIDKSLEKKLDKIIQNYPNIEEKIYKKENLPIISVVDVFTVKDSIIEFKLKNSGNDVAFLKGVQFVFGPISCGSNVCNPQLGVVDYSYVVELGNPQDSILFLNDIGLDSLSKIIRKSSWLVEEEWDSSTISDFLMKMIKDTSLLPTWQKESMLKNKNNIAKKSMNFVSWKDVVSQNSGSFLYFFQDAYFSIPKTPVLRISETIYPKDVSWFKVKLSIEKQNWLLNQCINSCSLQAYAIIHYDKNESIVTNKFYISFNNLDRLKF